MTDMDEPKVGGLAYLGIGDRAIEVRDILKFADALKYVSAPTDLPVVIESNPTGLRAEWWD